MGIGTQNSTSYQYFWVMKRGSLLPLLLTLIIVAMLYISFKKKGWKTKAIPELGGSYTVLGSWR